MKNTLLILICLTFSIGALAQKPVIFSLKGKAKLVVADNPENVLVNTAGYDVKSTDKLILKENSSVGILTEDGYAFLSGPGMFDLAFIARSSQMTESDFAEILVEQFEDALNPYFTTRAGLTGGGDDPEEDTPPPAKPSRPGTGNGSGTLIPLAPLGGKVIGSSLHFRWKAKTGSALPQAVQLILKDRDGNEKSRRQVRGSSIILSVDELGLEPGNKYTWEVVDPDNEDGTTGSTEISLISEEPVAKLLNSLYSEAIYLNADPGAKALLEASALQDEGYLQAAGDTLYQASKKFKKNELVQWIYRSFAYFNDLD